MPGHRPPPGPSGRTWLLTLTLTGLILTGAEAFWRSRGHQPSVVDDPELWSFHRGRVDDGGMKSVALVGASRIQLDFATDTFRRRFPDHTLVQLAIDGRYPVATLRDLAEDGRFRGVVIAAIDPNGLLRRNRAAQQEYVDFYDRRSTLNNRLNRVIGCWLQARLVILNPQVHLKKVLERLLRRYPLPPPIYVITRFDRSRQADYTKIDLAAHRRWRVGRLREGPAAPGRLTPQAWLEEALEIEPLVREIESRGGRVVLIVCPVTGETLENQMRQFPKADYWDRFAAATSAETIHFLDVPALAGFDCPDTSHLDYRDAPRFTDGLLDELVQRSVLPRK